MNGSTPYEWMQGSMQGSVTGYQPGYPEGSVTGYQPGSVTGYPQGPQGTVIMYQQPQFIDTSSTFPTEAQSQPSWARRYWWVIVLVIMMVIGGIVAAVIFLTKSSSSESEVTTLVALDPSSRAALPQYRPGDRVFLSITNPYPNTQWQFSIDGGLRYAVTTDINPESDGVVYTIPTNAFTTDFRIRMVNTDARSQSIFVSFKVLPVPILVSGPGNQTPEYSIGDQVNIQYDWSYPFSSLQAWRFDICENSDFQAAVRTVSNTLAQLNRSTKVLTWIIGDSANIPAAAVYYRLSTTGLSPVDVSVVSPEPIKIKLSAVPPTQFQFTLLQITRNNNSDTSIHPNESVIVRATYKNGPPPTGIIYSLSYSSDEKGLSFSVPAVTVPLNSSNPLEFNFQVPNVQTNRFVVRITTNTNLSFITQSVVVTNQFQLRSMSILSSAPYNGGSTVQTSVVHENVTAAEEYNNTKFEGSDNNGTSWSLMPSTMAASSIIKTDGLTTVTYSFTLPSRAITTYLIRAKNGLLVTQLPNPIQVIFSGSTDAFVPRTLAFVANIQNPIVVEGSTQTLRLSFDGSWSKSLISSRTCSFSINNKATWNTLNTTFPSTATGSTVDILIPAIPMVTSDVSMWFGFNNQTVVTAEPTLVKNRSIDKVAWATVDPNLTFGNRVVPSSAIRLTINHTNAPKNDVRCTRILDGQGIEEVVSLTLNDSSPTEMTAIVTAPSTQGYYSYRVYLGTDTEYKATDLIPVFYPLSFKMDGIPVDGGDLLGFANRVSAIYEEKNTAYGENNRSKLDDAMSYILRIESSGPSIFNDWKLDLLLRYGTVTNRLRQCQRILDDGKTLILLFVPRQTELVTDSTRSVSSPTLVAELSKTNPLTGTTTKQTYDIRSFNILHFLAPADNIPNGAGTGRYLPPLFRWQYASRSDLLGPRTSGSSTIKDSMVLRFSVPPSDFYTYCMYADLFLNRNYGGMAFPLFYFAPDYDTFHQVDKGIPGFIYYAASQNRDVPTNYYNSTFRTGDTKWFNSGWGYNPPGGQSLDLTKWWEYPLYPVRRLKLDGDRSFAIPPSSVPTLDEMKSTCRVRLRRSTDVTFADGTSSHTLKSFVIGIEQDGQRIIGVGESNTDADNVIKGTWFTQTYAWTPLQITFSKKNTYKSPKWAFVPHSIESPLPLYTDSFGSLNNPKHGDVLTYLLFRESIGGTANTTPIGDYLNPYDDTPF